MKQIVRCCLVGLLCILIATQLQAEEPYSGTVECIDIINWSHTDYGFTDHPLIVAELQKRYIDIALDYVERSSGNPEGERFTWTIESLDPLYQWWQEASPDRRRKLLRAIDREAIDVNVMPFNIHPLLNDTETEQLLDWIPEELARKFRPRIAIQNDVNGFPRAVASRLPAKGVRYVWLGMNGRHPFPIPTLSWWQMPDGQKLLLWNGDAYWDAYSYFGTVHWKAHPREVSDLTTRWPRDLEIFRADEKSVLQAHELCIRKLKELQKKGYPHPILPVTFSNVWRGDNDGPYWGIVDFVRKWNDMGLKPTLRLSTATASMERMERTMAPGIATLTGEFGDWWAFGMTALPRETSVARQARYLLQASVSPLLGPLSPEVVARTETVNRDLCVFYEHTFASKTSGSDIYGTFNQGSINEANRYAYRAYEYARWQLARRVRAQLGEASEGVYVFNTQQAPYSGWMQTEFSALRNKKATGLVDPATGDRIPFFKKGGVVRFWVADLPGQTVRHYLLTTDSIPMPAGAVSPMVETDVNGWPLSVQWPGMEAPLFQGEIGSFLAYAMTSGGWWGGDATLEPRPTLPATPVKVTETPYSIQYEQKLNNECLVSARRVLEIYKAEPRIRLRMVYDRKLHPVREKELFYIQFPLPDAPAWILTSNGGSVFTPYEDNIPNTCKRFYVADAWVAYQMEDGCRVWASRTSPLVSFGDNEFFRKGDISCPKDSYLLRSMVYNNSWGLNFPVEYSGEVVCEYDLFWTPEKLDAEQIRQRTDAYLAAPVLTIVPKERENPSYRRWLNGEEKVAVK